MRNALLGTALVIGLVCVVGCAKTDMPSADMPSADMPSHMEEHFARATMTQTAVINGSLQQAQSEARWLASHKPRHLPGPAIKKMQAAANQVVRAQTIEAAAQGVGAIGAACGGCHQQMAVDPGVASKVDMRFGTTLPARMARHQWAVDRMWEGLVGPAEANWIGGAETLMEAPLSSEDMPGFGGARAAQLGQRIHRLANDARTVVAPDARAELYGEVLASCARCHQSFR